LTTLTIARLSDHCYRVVTSTASGVRELALLRRHAAGPFDQ
jgi:hypothetical protein